MKQNIIESKQCVLPGVPLGETTTTRATRNERGFAIVYGLVILVLVTIAGTALLFMARKDHGNSADYSKMRSTSQAAEAALKACEGQFLNHPDIALAILKKYKLDPTYKYILNASDLTANVKTKYQMDGAGSPEYIAEIKGFDQDLQIVLIEGTGYGNGGKNKVLASYQLEGLKMVATPYYPPMTAPGGSYGLYLKEEGENINAKLTIVGNVYCGGMFRTQNTGTITIKGNVYAGSASSGEILNTWNVTGNSYFRGPISFKNYSPTFNGMVGFEKPCTLSVDANISNSDANIVYNIFSNDTARGTKLIKMGTGEKLLHSGRFPSTSVQTGTLQSNSVTIPDIAARVGICSGDTAPLTLLVDNIPASKKKDFTKIYGPYNQIFSADTLNKFYNRLYNDTNWRKDSLFNGYLVVTVNNASFQFTATPDTCKSKVVWLFTNTNFNPSADKFWYSSSANSISLIVVDSGSYLNTLHWKGLLRGYIYTRKTGKVQYKFMNQKLEGGICHVAVSSNNDNFEVVPLSTAADSLGIHYNDAIVQDLIASGLVSRPAAATCETQCSGGSAGSGGSGSGVNVLTLVDKKIRPKLLTKQM